LSGLGIGTALVQAKDLTRDEESSLFWIISAGGAVLGLILIALAPVLTATYAEPRLASLMVVSALKLALVGLSVVPMQLLSRALQFREIGAVQTLSSLGEAVIKIAFAFGGAGACARPGALDCRVGVLALSTSAALLGQGRTALRRLRPQGGRIERAVPGLQKLRLLPGRQAARH
jgi:PST family polysaccharide transporter